MSTYRIEIDRSLCSGFGSCVEHAPDIFDLDAGGIASSASARPTTPRCSTRRIVSHGRDRRQAVTGCRRHERRRDRRRRARRLPLRRDAPRRRFDGSSSRPRRGAGRPVRAARAVEGVPRREREADSLLLRPPAFWAERGIELRLGRAGQTRSTAGTHRRRPPARRCAGRARARDRCPARPLPFDAPNVQPADARRRDRPPRPARPRLEAGRHRGRLRRRRGGLHGERPRRRGDDHRGRAAPLARGSGARSAGRSRTVGAPRARPPSGRADTACGAR